MCNDIFSRIILVERHPYSDILQELIISCSFGIEDEKELTKGVIGYGFDPIEPALAESISWAFLIVWPKPKGRHLSFTVSNYNISLDIHTKEGRGVYVLTEGKKVRFSLPQYSFSFSRQNLQKIPNIEMLATDFAGEPLVILIKGIELSSLIICSIKLGIDIAPKAQTEYVAILRSVLENIARPKQTNSFSAPNEDPKLKEIVAEIIFLSNRGEHDQVHKICQSNAEELRNLGVLDNSNQREKLDLQKLSTIRDKDPLITFFLIKREREETYTEFFGGR